MPPDQSDDLISIAARKGMLTESEARTKLKGRIPTPELLLQLCLLN